MQYHAKPTLRIVTFVVILTVLTGCATGWPHRSSADLRTHIGPPRGVPSDCWLVWSDRRAELRDFEKQAENTGEYNWTESYRIVTQFAIRAEFESTRGNVSTALYIANKAIAATTNERQLITLYASKGLMLSAIGAKSAAREAFERSDTHIYGSRRYSDRYRFFIYLARGYISSGKGNLAVAEKNIRNALELVTDQFFYLRLDETIDLNYVRSSLVDNLVQQGRLGDAELMARDAVLRNRHYLEARQYSASSAQIWNQLATVYLKMGRLKDADFAIEVSLNMLEHDCAHPRSLPARNARNIRARIKVLQSHSS